MINSKQKLLGKHSFIPVNEARNVLNEIIAKNRGIPLKVARYKKLLLPKEVKEFYKSYDLPFDVS
ncbi:hypothetical protein [Tenacibaculum sp. 190524A02b]|uniref:hypothetical protein n=1 Tax=Tenacibaculum vairaonense TaxID=3137860 RepID=UPI0031FA9FEF